MTHIPTTPEGWMILAQALADTVDREMDEYDTLSPEDLVRKLPILISLVNSVAALRGQDGCFLDIRPDITLESQRELYQLESRAIGRLEGFFARIQEAGLVEDTRNRMKNHLVDCWLPRHQK